MRETWCLLLALAVCLGLALYPAAPASAEDSMFSEKAPYSCVYYSTNPDCDGNKGRWGMYRMYVASTGPGYVECGDCRTNQGCTSFWTSLRYVARCTAVAAPNAQFSHWTADGQDAGEADVKYFGKVGLHINGVFQAK